MHECFAPRAAVPMSALERLLWALPGRDCLAPVAAAQEHILGRQGSLGNELINVLERIALT